jgi:hypothetical protein
MLIAFLSLTFKESVSMSAYMHTHVCARIRVFPN